MVELNKDMISRLQDIINEGLVCGLGKPIPGGMCVEAAVKVILGEEHGDNPSCVYPTLRSFGIKLNDSWWSGDKVRAKGLSNFAVAQLGTADNFDNKYFANKMSEYAIRVVVPFALRSAVKVNPKFATELQQAADRCEQEGSQESAVEAEKVAYAAAAAAADANAAYADAAANASAAASAAATSADYAAYAYAAANASAAAAAYYVDAAKAAAAAAYYASAAADYAGVPANEIDQMLTNFAEYAVQVLIEMETPGSKFLTSVCSSKQVMVEA